MIATTESPSVNTASCAGGAAGAVPVLIGWTAVQNELDWAAVVLFAIIFLYGIGFVERGFSRFTMIYAIPKAYPFIGVPLAAANDPRWQLSSYPPERIERLRGRVGAEPEVVLAPLAPPELPEVLLAGVSLGVLGRLVHDLDG